MVEFEVMNGSGDILVANTHINTELFWALKGACSSSLGVVVSLTLQLHKLPANEITRISFPDITVMDDMIAAMNWYQNYSTLNSITELTLVSHINSNAFYMEGVYMGPKQELLSKALSDMSAGLNGIFTTQQIIDACEEGSFLDAVIWWSGDNDITSLEDLLQIRTLPPIEERSQSRRKSKSILIYDMVSESAMKYLIEQRSNGELNSIEWKSYGGRYACMYVGRR